MPVTAKPLCMRPINHPGLHSIRGGQTRSLQVANAQESPATLAFLIRVGNNPPVAVMRIACEVAIALCLTFPATEMAQQQDPAGANSAAQVPPPNTAAAEKIPAESVPVPEAKAPESVVNSKEKTNAASAGKVTRAASAKHRKHSAPVPEDGPRKIVVRKGGATEPAAQIAPGMTPEETVRQRQTAEGLLAATDDQLQMLAVRAPDARRQETVGQIRNYMENARLALKEGDVRRANTLAEKAHLLSDDLVRR